MTDDNYVEVIDGIAEQLFTLMDTADEDIRQKCFRLAEHAEWKEFIPFYYKAFDFAIRKAEKRNCL